jgi:hypothetical protein
MAAAISGYAKERRQIFSIALLGKSHGALTSLLSVALSSPRAKVVSVYLKIRRIASDSLHYFALRPHSSAQGALVRRCIHLLVSPIMTHSYTHLNLDDKRVIAETLNDKFTMFNVK